MNCEKEFKEIIERFNDKEKTHNTNSQFYKKSSLSFFPQNDGLNKQDFLEKNLNYYIHQKDSFYCNRKTCWQKDTEKAQTSMF